MWRSAGLMAIFSFYLTKVFTSKAATSPWSLPGTLAFMAVSAYVPFYFDGSADDGRRAGPEVGSSAFATFFWTKILGEFGVGLSS